MSRVRRAALFIGLLVAACLFTACGGKLKAAPSATLIGIWELDKDAWLKEAGKAGPEIASQQKAKWASLEMRYWFRSDGTATETFVVPSNDRSTTFTWKVIQEEANDLTISLDELNVPEEVAAKHATLRMRFISDDHFELQGDAMTFNRAE